MAVKAVTSYDLPTTRWANTPLATHHSAASKPVGRSRWLDCVNSFASIASPALSARYPAAAPERRAWSHPLNAPHVYVCTHFGVAVEQHTGKLEKRHSERININYNFVCLFAQPWDRPGRKPGKIGKWIRSHGARISQGIPAQGVRTAIPSKTGYVFSFSYACVLYRNEHQQYAYGVCYSYPKLTVQCVPEKAMMPCVPVCV